MREQEKEYISAEEEEIQNMSTHKLARWLALLDGMDVIQKKIKKEGRNFRHIDIKPLALCEYVDVTSQIVYRELTENTRRKG